MAYYENAKNVKGQNLDIRQGCILENKETNKKHRKKKTKAFYMLIVAIHSED